MLTYHGRYGDVPPGAPRTTRPDQETACPTPRHATSRSPSPAPACAGLGMAIALRRDGIEDFVVLERADDLGGTWRDNSYPGCACDIASVLYSYSDEQNPAWTRAFARQPEIHGLHPRRRRPPRRHRAHALRPRGDGGRLGRGAPSGGRSGPRAATSPPRSSSPRSALSPIRRSPTCPGSTASGTAFHSARWDHDLDLSGRRVAVVGTGASAIQFVPEIQPQVGHLDLFQRTPPWVLPRGNPVIPEGWRRRFARHPRLLAWLRAVGVLAAMSPSTRLPAPRRDARGGATGARPHRAPGGRSRAAGQADPRLPPRLQARPGLQHLVSRAHPGQRRRHHRRDRRDRARTGSSTPTGCTIRSTRSSSAPAFTSPTCRSATGSAGAAVSSWPIAGRGARRRTWGWPSTATPTCSCSWAPTLASGTTPCCS